MNFDRDLKKALEDYERSLVEHYKGLPHPKRSRTMKDKKWFYSLGALAAVFVLFIAGQSLLPGMKAKGQMMGSGENYNYEYARAEEAPMEYAVEDFEGASMDSGYSLEEEKIIRTYSLGLETKDIVETTRKLEELVKKEEGFIDSSYQDGKLEPGEWAHAYYSIRLPRGRVETLRSLLEELGQINYFSQSSDNVTRAYKDTEARIELLKLKETKLKELLDRAENLEDVIALESSIMDLQFEREQITNQLRDMDSRIDYDSYHLDISQVKTFTEKGFLVRFKDSFGEGFRNFIRSLEDLVIFLSYNWAYLVLVLLLAGGVLLAVGKRRKKL